MNLRSKTAADLMNAEVAIINASATLLAATKEMHARRLRCLIVSPSRPGEGLGIITTKDIISVLDDEEPTVLRDTLVSEAMTRPAVSAQATMCIPDCISLMRMTGVRRLPVLSGDELVGLLSYSDVFNHVAMSAV